MPQDSDDVVERRIVVLPADGPLPSSAELLAAGVADEAAVPDAPPAGPDRLIPPPGSGLPGWAARVGAVIRAGWAPMLLVTAICGALPLLVSVRLGDTVVLAPLLQELGGGAGLLLLPALWLLVVAVQSLLSAVCLAAVSAVAVGWAADGRVPTARSVVRLAGHRVHRLWGWLAVVHAVDQAARLVAPAVLLGGHLGTDTGRSSAVTAWSLAVLSWAAVGFAGVLGPVVLFEWRTGPRRAVHLLRHGPRGPVSGLVAVSAALVLLPWAARSWSADGVGWSLTIGLTVAGTLVWAVAAVVTYAASVAATAAHRGAVPPLTSARMRDALAAEEA
jgi:hypothetical protein